MSVFFRFNKFVFGFLVVLCLAQGTSAQPVDFPTQPACRSTLDRVKLERAESWIQQNKNYIDSFVVRHCNQVILENYYRGYNNHLTHEIQSATKTFSAALIGIALDQKILKSLEQPLYEILPQYAYLLTGAKRNITLRHVLMMTTGLRWIDFGPQNSFERIYAAPDSIAFVLAEPLVSLPGQKFAYNTGSSHLLSAIIHKTTNLTTVAYAQKYLFGPLGITDVYWPSLLDGIAQGGWGIYMRPSDMAKFGQLYLDGGRWKGRQLISQAFIDEATRNLVPTGQGGGYGFQMWINDFGNHDMAAARGYGGQDIFILEDLDLVVVFTGDIRFPAEMAKDVKELMEHSILPAFSPSH